MNSSTIGKTALPTLLLAAGLLSAAPAHAAPAASQEAAAAERGWLGLGFASRLPEGPGEGTVQVSQVVPGGPAELAGAVVGDRILEFDGRPGGELLHWDPAQRPRFSAGDSVRLAIDRGGERLELVVVAAGLSEICPAVFAPCAVHAALEGLDSLAALASLGLETSLPSFIDSLTAAFSPMTEALWPSMDTRFGVLKQTMDSLSLALPTLMDSLSLTLPTLMDSMAVTFSLAMDSLANAVAGSRAVLDASLFTTAVSGLSEALAAEEGLLATLSTAMDSVSNLVADSLPSMFVGASPLSLYSLGRNRIAGAELARVSPELGSYFGVEGGVLVVEVVEGSPAEAAGFASGDVIVAAGGREVGSLADLRRALADLRRAPTERAAPVQVAVVRAGERLELEIR